MLYIILAVLLLGAVLAIVILKNKKGGKSAGKLPAFGKKKGNKKKSSHHDDEQEELSHPAFERAADTRVGGLSDDTRREIEQLIRQRNYTAAEAQINQALHKNPTHQGLYLMLAEVHMHQDDEFALKQLIEHLRLSGLHSIVETIDAKKEVFKAQSQRESEQAKVSALAGGAIAGASVADFDQFNTPSTSNNFAQFESDNNTADFSQFSQPSTPSATPASFDDFLNTSTPAPASNNSAMDFSFSEPTPTPAPAPVAETTSMDFSFSEPTPAPVPVAEPSMDFSFSEPTPAPVPVAEPSMDFSFSEPTPTPAPVAEPSMDFNFSEPVPASVSTAEPSMDFNFSEPTPAPVSTPVAEVTESFDFNFNEPAVASAPVSQPSTDFDFDEPTSVAPVTTNQGLDFNFSQIEESVTPSAPEAFDFSNFNLDGSVQQPEHKEPVVDVSEFLTANDTVDEFASNELDYSNLNINNTSTTANVSSHTIENLGIMEPLIAPESTAQNFAPQETTASVSGDDPLLQAFPTLANYQTAEVNLNLAEQYIKLGAYEAAQALLQDRQAFNAEQNRSAELLLQRLAS